MSKVIPSYGKPKGYGKKVTELARLHEDDVVIQEKIDGSQISWYVDANGVLHVQSKGKAISNESCADGFRKSFDHLTRLHNSGLIPSGIIFRGEALKAKKHNIATYEREPKGNIVIYDYAHFNLVEDDKVEGGYRAQFTYPEANKLQEELEAYAEKFQIDFAPVYAILPRLTVFTEEMFNKHYENESVLGGPIEGVVLKNYNQVCNEGKTLMGKWVADKFKEVAGKKSGTPKGAPSVSPIFDLAVNYRTEARWRKAIQHLGDEGKLSNSVKDIGPLVEEIKRDIEDEELDRIKDALYALHRKDFHRVWLDGFPQFYKKVLNEDE